MLEDFVALQNDGLPNRLCQVTLPRATWSHKQGIFSLSDECGSREVKHETAVHLRVEAEVKVIQALIRVAEACLLATTFQQPVRAAG